MTVKEFLLTEYAKASADYKRIREAGGGSLLSSGLYEPSLRLDKIRTWIDTLPAEIMNAEIKKGGDHQ